MANLLQQLHGDQALLVMYVADELPVADRADLDRRLSEDAGLRADLERVSHAYGTFTAGMAELDAATPLHADVSAAVRRASAAIRTWHARPVLQIAPATERGASFGWRIWAIPSAAAAIVLVVIGISLYNKSASPRFVRGQVYTLSTPGIANGVATPMVVPPPVNPAADDDASLIAMTTPPLVEDVVGPGFDRDPAKEDRDAASPHDEGGAVFEIPLDAGQ